MEYPMIEVTPVDPGDIEGSLDNLWEQNKGDNRFRACLFNLIIYSSSSIRLPYLSMLAEHIIEKFPSRVLMIKEGDSPSDQIKSSVANLKKKAGMSSIFCDYIEFEVGRGAHKSIPFMVLPHLVADHPIYLLWDDDPLLKDPVSFALENTADRTIFDSNVTTDLKKFAETLIDLQGLVECSIADLNWARITPFKDLLTTIFTDQVHFRVIDTLKDLHIYYNKDQGNQGGYYRALYLQAYLASMMNFKYVSTLKSSGETHIHYRHKSKEVTICLLETNQKDLYPGFIQRVEFTSYDGTHLKLERMQKNKQVVEVQTTFCTHCQVPSHHIFDPDLNNRTLTREIYSKGTDPHFEKVLKLLSQCEGI